MWNIHMYNNVTLAEEIFNINKYHMIVAIF